MSELIGPFSSTVLVGIGAVTGSSMRMFLTNNLRKSFFFKYLATFICNVFASFCLGLFIAFESNSTLAYQSTTSQLLLFVCVGFLGSLSTFSTFAYELFQTLLAHRWNRFFFLGLFSLLGGLLAVSVGLTLGDF